MRDEVVVQAQRRIRSELTALAGTFSQADVEGMVTRGDLSELHEESRRAHERVAELVLGLFLTSLRASARVIPRLVEDTSRWRVLRAQADIRHHLAEQLSDDQKRVVTTTLYHRAADGLPLRALLVRLVLGLSLPQATRLLDYQRTLLLPGVVRPNDPPHRREPITVPQLAVILGARARQERNDRADFMGLAEGQQAWGRAQQEAWVQAVEGSLVATHEVVRVWRVTHRNTRDSHEAMHDQERGLTESFLSGDGNSLQFPGDHAAPIREWAGCNCSLHYETRKKLAYVV